MRTFLQCSWAYLDVLKPIKHSGCFCEIFFLEDEKEKENDSKKKSSPRQNKPKSERLHSVPVRKQGTQKASPRKSNSLERPKKKAPTAAGISREAVETFNFLNGFCFNCMCS